ncbi:MAG: hypothetical protein R3C20_04945 [Planctomycetaceae bacterium]
MAKHQPDDAAIIYGHHLECGVFSESFGGVSMWKSLNPLAEAALLPADICLTKTARLSDTDHLPGFPGHSEIRHANTPRHSSDTRSLVLETFGETEVRAAI